MSLDDDALEFKALGMGLGLQPPKVVDQQGPKRNPSSNTIHKELTRRPFGITTKHRKVYVSEGPRGGRAGMVFQRKINRDSPLKKGLSLFIFRLKRARPSESTNSPLGSSTRTRRHIYLPMFWKNNKGSMNGSEEDIFVRTKIFFKTLCAITLDHAFVFLIYSLTLAICAWQLQEMTTPETLEFLATPLVFYTGVGLLTFTYIFYYGFFILFKIPSLGRLTFGTHKNKN